MKYTLLQLTQSILSSLNSDEVNSIGDTTESMQVAECIKTSYMNMLGRYDLPEHNQPIQLTPSNDPTKPVLMYKPEGVNRIEEVRYFDSNTSDSEDEDQYGSYQHGVNTDLVPNTNNTATAPPGYKWVNILAIDKFIDMVSRFDTTESNVLTFNLPITSVSTQAPSMYSFNYKNDRQPEYYCVISNYYIIFDSFDYTQDSTLQASKTLCYGWVMPEFLMEDTFIPNLDEQQFPLLLNEAKSLAFLELKQIAHPKAEKEVMRQLSSLQKLKFLANRPTPFEELPNFGRRIGLGGYATYRR